MVNGIGGNTSCVSIEVEDNIFIFDAGSGIRELDKYMDKKGNPSLQGHLFLTHYHWSQIKRLPFFKPAFRKKNRFRIYGEPRKGTSLHEILAEQMAPPYFPVNIEPLTDIVNFKEIKGEFRVEIVPNVTISTIRLNHPVSGAIGFRLDHRSGSFCYISDHEHPENGLNQKVVNFVQKSSVLIHDAQYLPGEKRTKRLLKIIYLW